MGGHILKAELADVKGKECEGLIVSIRFCQEKTCKESMGL